MMSLPVLETVHSTFLKIELHKRLGFPDSDIRRFWKSIARELHYRLVEWPFDEMGEGFHEYPVSLLHDWMVTGGGFDAEWMATEDGVYVDDEGLALPAGWQLHVKDSEVIAAYGLWLMVEFMEELGPARTCGSEGLTPNGFSLREVEAHRSACLLLAYQTLVYSFKLAGGDRAPLSDVDEVLRHRLAILGKRGATKKHAKMARLRRWAVEKYNAGSWSSANHAAHELKAQVLQYGRSIDANLSEQNAQRTIAEWFRKSS